ncbi:hypothetical protein DPMN_154109 [Dreissena polymorpha]|uniref:Uncharacterized protein n=1 Tax=Dreissena polymorpha TaxID=45954 RepID=A0A9D4FM00_DREPO|nr:hypothetical protein DPMN_154109 [Dreissena polymorpha]
MLQMKLNVYKLFTERQTDGRRTLKTNVLTNFHDWAKIVNLRAFTMKTAPPTGGHKNAPPTGGHAFSPIWTIFILVRDINKTNVLTNFHDDWAKIVYSRVFTRKTPPPPGSHVIQLTRTIFELYTQIKETNVLTKFHENWAKNVTSRVFTCFHYIHIEKNTPPTGGHVFLPIWTIFELVRDINKTNVLTNFHDDWAKIVTSSVFTSHVIELTGTIFTLNSHIKVFTCFHYIHIENNAPPTCGHIVSPIWTIFELFQDINKTLFTRKTAPPPGSHVIQLTRTIFELYSHIKETNVLTKFNENLAKNMTSRVFTCFHYIHIEKNAPPTGGHVFSPIWTIFELVRDFNKTNVLTNFHDDWAKIVTSRVFTRKTAPPTGGHVFQRTGTTFELNQHIIKV